MSESDPQDSAPPSVGARLPRRGFLKVGLAGTAVVALGGVGLALRSTLLRERPEGGLEALTMAEYSVLAAICDRVCPEFGKEAPRASALGVARMGDKAIATLDPATQKELKILLRLFDNALLGFVFDGRITPFTKLAPEAQDRALSAWAHSRVGFRVTGYQALRALAASLYYGDERTWPGAGYPGPPDVSAYRAQRAAASAAAGGGKE